MEGAHRNGEQYLHAHEFCRFNNSANASFHCQNNGYCKRKRDQQLTMQIDIRFAFDSDEDATQIHKAQSFLDITNGLKTQKDGLLLPLHVLWPLNSISNVPIAFAQMAVRKSERHFAYVGPRNLCSDIKFTDDVTMKN
ncbi:hypothetical protein D918_08045 [Trichuris suis]|nr:hypothetical protein D918_08045 [Trichuris suis]